MNFNPQHSAFLQSKGTALAQTLTTLQRILLPPLCLLCGAAGKDDRDLCGGCAADLPYNRSACPGCAGPLPVGQSGRCLPCQAHRQPFDRAFIPFRYQPPMDFLIRGLKFNGRLSYGRLLGELFADALVTQQGSRPDCILPVPLHPLRLRERGFNQALELARATARRYRIPLITHGLRRTRHTPPQTQLDAHQRQINLIGAFRAEQSFTGLRVAIMDDVVTTTSTVAECARVVRSAGASTIEIWAVGRTPDSAATVTSPVTSTENFNNFNQGVN